ncbi:M23 family metallopeptidase [Natronincola ferrireducens]|uniref:Peptidase family M23 n=1 Tax=Natronincola ferrireducens TaxID=393762 RepID=A0A1G9A5X9_9FIRM|nr:M23 family metallopeptidase [Natronincola ferrireducens]SDK21840.1 Peptidase family M23 [Natronincola ferrireducens]
MEKLRHLAKPKKKRLTFMIIPNSTGKIVEFTIPSWIPIFLLISFTLSIVSTVVTSGTLHHTTLQLHTAEDSLSLLQGENKRQAEEITALTLRSAEIENQLLGLNDLKIHVLDMVGLDNKGTLINNEESFFMATRSLQTLPLSMDDYETSMTYLEALIEEQKETMSKLIVDVEKQLDYLDALPNLIPAAGRITSPFGYRISPINRRREFHRGIDIANQTNTNIVAAGSGVVTYSGYNGSYGRMIIIAHGNGYTTVYAHNRENLVEVGQRVNKGDVIAKMGSTGRSTGPHVHFEIRLHGNPIDPKDLLED